jgi:protocatechuate 3,4-dioxygenase beta subunit
VELRVALGKGAAVTGRVLFPSGVQVFRGILNLRVQRLGTGADSGDASTDALTIMLGERGEYRVSALSPGRYSIGAPARNSVAGVMRSEPVIVDVAEGAELTGIDITIEASPPGLTMPFAPAPKPAGGAIIRGSVTGTSGEPLAAATVYVVAGSRRMNATSDADGRFTVTGVPAGTVTVESTLTGYSPSRHGMRDSHLPGLPIAVKENQALDGIDLVMARTSVISGVVVDEGGEPIQDASVQLLRIGVPARGMVAIPLPPDPLLTLSQPSDDRGRFRVTGVNPGSYLLVASIAGEVGGVAGGPRSALVPAYYPGTPDFAAASRLDVGAEQDLSGFTVPIARVPVARIEGVATDSSGRPLTGQIRLSRARTPGLAQQPRQLPAGPNGEFAFADVRPGEYVVHAVTGTGPSGPEFAVQPITVADTDPPPMALRSSPGSRLSGSIVLEGPPDALLWGYASNVVPLDIALSAAASATSSGAFSSGTTFMMSGLGGLVRLLFSTPDEKWFLKSILLDGTDIADRPFEFGNGRAYTDVEVVFSANGASLSGRATDDRGSPARHYAALVFGVDRDTWFQGSRWVKMARADNDGTFYLTSLPPGDYFVAALDRLEDASDWQDPEFLRDISLRAVRVTLAERQAQTSTLRVIRR